MLSICQAAYNARLAQPTLKTDWRNQAITLTTPVGIPTRMLTIKSMSLMAMLRQPSAPLSTSDSEASFIAGRPRNAKVLACRVVVNPVLASGV